MMEEIANVGGKKATKQCKKALRLLVAKQLAK